MLRLLAIGTDGPDALARRGFARRLDCTVLPLAAPVAAVDATLLERPQAVIFFDSGNDKYREELYRACREICSDDRFADLRTMLVRGPLVDRAEWERVHGSLCDDVAAWPMHLDDLHHHLSQLLQLPARRSRRIVAPVRVSVLIHGSELPAVNVVNVSPEGAGIEIPTWLEKGAVRIRFFFQDGSSADVDGRVAWSHPNPARKTYFAGLHFSTLPERARRKLSQVSLYDIAVADDGDGGTQAVVFLQGALGDDADLSELAERLGEFDSVEFRLRAVSSLSGAGQDSWLRLITGLNSKPVSLHQCSVEFMQAVRGNPALLGDAAIRSAQAPHRCSPCGRTWKRLVDTALLFRDGSDRIPPPIRCNVCRQALEFEDNSGQYFALSGE